MQKNVIAWKGENMTTYIETLRNRYIVEKDQKKYRKDKIDSHQQAEEYEKLGLSDLKRATSRLTYMLEQETPVVYPDEKIALIRTVPVVQEIFTEKEWDEIRKDH